MANDYGLSSFNPSTGLLGFGGAQVPMLSQAQLSGLLGSFGQFPTGQFGQKLSPATDAPVSGQFDPYAVLRANPQLANNPNFAWLNSLNLAPINLEGWDGLINTSAYPGPAAPPTMGDQVKKAGKNLVDVHKDVVSTIVNPFRSLF